MQPHRLRAPSTDGSLLAEPPLDEAVARLTANAERLSHWDYDFQGRPAGWLRALARRQALEQARVYLGRYNLDVPALPDESAPLVVTGHQPDLFHPGVWIKNFAAAAIAKTAGGVGLNLVVDNDLLKSPAIRVPEHGGEGSGLRLRRVEFDDRSLDVPFEELTVSNEALFATFPDRVHETLAGEVADPILDEFWPLAMAQRSRTDRLGLRFALARRALEGSWGARNFEVPLSTLCETEAFLWFAAHLLAHLPRFQQIHNDALTRYRSLYRIRSKHHPVPALGREGEWLEAPFWIWRANEPRRRPLLARQLARTLQLRVRGEDEPLLELPLGPDREACCAVEQLQGLLARRIRLRTRALTTTMFARYLLGDLFIHGIGGAKYDELGDAIAGRFFAIEPPSYLTLSQTLWLNLGTDPASPARLKSIDRQLRDLSYNPDRNLSSPTSAESLAWIEAKQKAIAKPVGDASARLHRYLEIRRCNEALQPLVIADRETLFLERNNLLAGLHQNALAHHREYALVLHSRSHVHEVFARTLPAAFEA